LGGEKESRKQKKVMGGAKCRMGQPYKRRKRWGGIPLLTGWPCQGRGNKPGEKHLLGGLKEAGAATEKTYTLRRKGEKRNGDKEILT